MVSSGQVRTTLRKVASTVRNKLPVTPFCQTAFENGVAYNDAAIILKRKADHVINMAGRVGDATVIAYRYLHRRAANTRSIAKPCRTLPCATAATLSRVRISPACFDVIAVRVGQQNGDRRAVLWSRSEYRDQRQDRKSTLLARGRADQVRGIHRPGPNLAVTKF